MTDKDFCHRVGQIIFDLTVLGANFKKEKEVAEFKKDNEKYETEYEAKQLKLKKEAEAEEEVPF